MTATETTIIKPKYNIDIAFRLKQTRMEAKITQTLFAEKLGISLSAVKGLEKGNFSPNIGIIRKWHKLFKKPYDWILDGKY